MSSNADPRLQDILHAYLQARDAGLSPDRDAILRDHPDLADELRAYFADESQLHSIARSIQQLGQLPTIDESTSPSPTTFNVIKYFGDYEIIDEIARGGMGVVFRAKQVSLNRLVAVKMILKGELATAHDVQRFRREAEAAASLDHPNIVPIYEVGEHSSHQYFSMKLVEGGQLSGKSKSQSEAVRIVAQVAKAIHYAHQRGILHRDLKPANILLDLNREPLVTDFGLAKRVGGEAGNTRSGAILGTPSYMPPEQARGEKLLTTAADVYSLGAILYELLTGRPPFQSDSALGTLMQVMEDKPTPLRKLDKSIHRDLETVCLKCLEKDPSRRYASAEALCNDLEHWLRGEPVLARPAGTLERGWRWMRRNPVVASLSAMVLMLLLVTVIGSVIAVVRIARAYEQAEQKSRESQQRLARWYIDRGFRHHEERDTVGALPWFAEALKLDSFDPARAEMHRLRLASTIRSIPKLNHIWTHNDHVALAQFSPDYSRILTAGRSEAILRDRVSGEQIGETMTHPGPIAYAMFSPDGKRVFTLGWRGVKMTSGKDATKGVARLWDANTGKPLFDFVPMEIPQQWIRFSNDGERLLSLSATVTGNLQLYQLIASVYDATTLKPLSEPYRHTTCETGFGSLCFSADGRRMLVTNGPDDRMPPDNDADSRIFDTSTMKPIGKKITHGGRVPHGAFSPDGKSFLTVSSDKTVRVWHTETGEPKLPEMKHDAAVGFATFSPDGRWLVSSDAAGFVCLWDAVTGKQYGETQKHSEWEVWYAAFSPDSSRLVTVNGVDVRLWDVAKWDQLRLVDPATLKLKPYAIPFAAEWYRHAPFLTINDISRRLFFTSDSLHLVVLSDEGVLQRYRTDDVQPVGDPFRSCTSASVSRSGRHLLTVSNPPLGMPGGAGPWLNHLWQTKPSMVAHLWDLATAMPDSSVARPLPAMSVTPPNENGLIVLSHPNHELSVWNLRENRPVTKPVPIQVKNWSTPHLSPDGTLLMTEEDVAVGNETRLELTVWDTATGKPIGPKWRVEEGIYRARIRPDNRAVLLLTYSFRDTGGNFFAVQEWDPKTGQAIRERIETDVAFGEAVQEPLYSPDSRRIFLGGKEGKVLVMDLATAKVIGTLVHGSEIANLTVSDDDTKLATAGEDGTARVWDLATMKPMTPPLLIGKGNGKMLRFSPDGRRLFSAVDSVRIWDIADGVAITLPMRGGRVFDGTLVTEQILYGNDGLEIYQSYNRNRGGSHPVEDRTVVSSVRLQPESRDVEELRTWCEVMSMHRIDDTGGFVAITPTEAVERWRSLRMKPIAVTEYERIAWHSQMVRIAMNNRQWSMALKHLDAIGVADLTAKQNRADVCAELGMWKEADAELTALTQAWPSSIDIRTQHMTVMLKMGDLARYRVMLREVWTMYGDTQWPGWVLELLTMSILLPDSGADPALLEKFRKQMIDPDQGKSQPKLAGALHYRAGRFAEAVPLLREASNTTSLDAEAVIAKCFLSMSYMRLGKKAEAQKVLGEAIAWTGPKVSFEPLRWADRVLLESLRNEATMVIERK